MLFCAHQTTGQVKQTTPFEMKLEESDVGVEADEYDDRRLSHSSKSTKAPSIKSTKAPSMSSVKSTKAPSIKSRRLELIQEGDDEE